MASASAAVEENAAAAAEMCSTTDHVTNAMIPVAATACQNAETAQEAAVSTRRQLAIGIAEIDSTARVRRDQAEQLERLLAKFIEKRPARRLHHVTSQRHEQSRWYRSGPIRLTTRFAFLKTLPLGAAYEHRRRARHHARAIIAGPAAPASAACQSRGPRPCRRRSSRLRGLAADQHLAPPQSHAGLRPMRPTRKAIRGHPCPMDSPGLGSTSPPSGPPNS